MHKKFLNILICKRCGSPFAISKQIIKENEEIIGGELVCRCDKTVEIVNGIPRFVYNISQIKKKTIERFTYEWRTFSDYNLNNFFRCLPKKIDKDFFKGKLGLDAGCGAGRHIRTAVELGATMVGVDISRSVDIAYAKNIKKESTMFIQCDIDDMPFVERAFDFIYSFGVLQHLPDMECGLKALVPLLKNDGVFFLWVYQKSARKIVLEYFRRMLGRLPNYMLYLLANFMSYPDYYLAIGSYKLINKIIPIENFSPPHIREYSKYNFKICRADWFDRLSAPISNFYTKEELIGYMQRAGINKFDIEADRDYGWKIFIDSHH